MTDVVVTVPKNHWQKWIEEGQLPGEEEGADEYYFWIGGGCPNIRPGERVYIVAHGKLRGYAPLHHVFSDPRFVPGSYALVRRGGAVAVTIDEPMPGFRGWRYRWWNREDERPFPEWERP
jgi:hypothetical protein